MSLDEDCLEFLDAVEPNTRRVYRIGLSLFRKYYNKPVSSFLDEIEKDLARPRRKRKRVAVNTIKGFVEWLREKNYAPKTIRTYVASLQSLTTYFEIPISLRYVRLPPAIPEAKKYPWTLEKIGEFFKLMDVETLALASCIFQSGLSLKDLLVLNYGDIKNEFETGEKRICLDLVRIKTDTPHMTFIGEYAYERLKKYLKVRGRLKPEDSLFPVSERTVHYRFRIVARELIRKMRERIKYGPHTWNPCSPHSLRTAFRTLLRDAGAPEEYVEFWMGHNIGDIRKTYTMHSRDGWRKIYMKYEPAITPSDA